MTLTHLIKKGTYPTIPAVNQSIRLFFMLDLAEMLFYLICNSIFRIYRHYFYNSLWIRCLPHVWCHWLSWWRHPLCLTSSGHRFFTAYASCVFGTSVLLAWIPYFFTSPNSRSGVHRLRLWYRTLWRHVSTCMTSSRKLRLQNFFAILSDLFRTQKR